METLAVTGIILLLTTLTAVAVRGFHGGTNRRAAVGNLMGVLEQARTLAISDGRATYVVFASVPAGQTTDASMLSDARWGRAYALFEDKVVTDDMGAADFQPEQRSAWLYLPGGVAFKCDGTPPSLTATAPAADDPTTFPLSTAAGGRASLPLPYLRFDTAGQIVDHGGNLVDAGLLGLRVLLFEGAATGAGVEVCTRREAENAGDGRKYALDEILLQPTTGRARYTLDPVNNGTPTPPAAP